MTCDEPGCTGVHQTSRPYGELCPAARRRHNARPYRQSIGGQTMKYLADLRYRRGKRGTAD